MITIGILDYNIFDKDNERQKELKNLRNKIMKEEGVNLIIVDMKNYDENLGQFTKYKTINNNEYEIIEENIMPKLIRIRTSQNREEYITALEKRTIFFPSKQVLKLATDKWTSYKAFTEHQPLTRLLSKIGTTQDAINDFGDEIIIKPREGNGGRGIEKIKTIEIEKRIEFPTNEKEKYIIQKVCDFNHGYPGLCNENHDLRIVCIGGKITYVTLRTNPNDFRVNTSQGGDNKEVSIHETPKEPMKIVTEYLTMLQGEKSGVVSFDFGFDMNQKKRVLIEPNYSPGFDKRLYNENKELMEKAFKAYAQEFNRILSTTK